MSWSALSLIVAGRWHWTWTRDELIRNGTVPTDVNSLAGPGIAVFANGGYRGHRR